MIGFTYHGHVSQAWMIQNGGSKKPVCFLRSAGTSPMSLLMWQVASGEIMGSTRYLNIVPQDYVLEIGYTFLGKAYQRTRVNTLTKYLLLENAFERLSANRIELRTDQRNTRSQRAIERIGAVKEGVLRKHRIVQQAYVRDTVVYSILASEWPTIKSRLAETLT
jgi:RimJ/RimL family protein N-acetyltransferase